MAISEVKGCNGEALLLEDTAIYGVVDYKGRPALRLSSGRWKSAGYIICVEIAERFALYGIGANLIMYLTGPFGQSVAEAAVNVNTWSGISAVTPLLGAFVADSFLGRYRTIAVASLLYILGLGCLTLSAFLPSISGSDCEAYNTMPGSPSFFKVTLFFFSLYLVAAVQGGHRPCTQAFGADQFNGEDPVESKAKSSFFNWWFFGSCVGILITILVVSYIQENFSWGLGFGIPCIAMLIGTAIFLLGTKTYRFSVTRNEKSPFMRIFRVFVVAYENRRRNDMELDQLSSHQCSHQFKFLNKALSPTNNAEEVGRFCSGAEIEEAKAVLGLLPIWGSCLMYGVVFAQSGTFFTKQAATMDRVIFSDFRIPAVSLLCFNLGAILVSLPIYDRILVPAARYFTGIPSGITMLQRIGTGIFMSVFVMVIAALVEVKRLRVAQEHGLADDPSATVPMSIWWMTAQNILFGVADTFTIVGMQEFFYDQVPTDLRSIGVALYLTVYGTGSFLSSFLVSVIEHASGGDSRESWFSNNLNRAHLDYFYWLLAALSALGFASYLHFARSYIYNKKGL